MKRFVWGVAVAIIIMLGAGGLPASAATTNNFRITNYDIDYQLGRDSDGRSTLKTVETITANFPQSNQNHGLERALPKSYGGHPTSLEIQSVADERGKALAYSTSTNAGNMVLRIGDKDRYVHGLTTYVITYTQRDVTRYFADSGKDEFYWDTNGVDWAVPINRLTVKIHLNEAIVSALTGDMSCYQGAMGVGDSCELIRDNDIIATTVANLQPGQNATIALGFNTSTFSSYAQSPMEKLLAILAVIWVVLAIITSAIAVICIIWLARRYSRISERRREMGAIVPEYLPPSAYSVLVSAQIEGVATKAFTAALMSLAVRHYIKIYQVREKTTFRAAEYELELVKPGDDLSKEEQSLLALLFPAGATARFAMSSLSGNYTLGKALQAVLATDVIASIKGEYALRHKDTESARWFKRFGLVTLLIGIFTLSPLMLITSVIAYVYGVSLWPLTDAGLALRRYLLGLKMYISVAEVERLKMLQSPEGAEKVGGSVDAGDSVQLVKLYERVLPYAVLFGQETEWNKQLGAYYETTGNQPDWYSGSGAFNAVAFGAAMGSFSTTSSYQVASSSSSSGSGGGGFSGGGGGGGGGGGW